MSEWKTYKLGDIAELRKEQIVSNGVEQPYIGLEHIEQQSLRLNGVGSSDNVVSNKFKFHNGDTLYGRLRPYFRKVYNPKFEGVCSTEIFVIKNKKNVDKDFLYYLVATEEFTNIANSGSSGTHMPRADWKQLEKSEWNIPDLPTQTQIAQILTSLDEKIELNLQMNQTLEAMAKAIFKEWFVDFKFPGFDGVLVDGLPKGWRNFSLSDLVDTVSKTFKFPDGKAIFLNTSDILEGKFLHTNYTKFEDLPGQAKKSIQKGDILFSEIRPANKRYAFVDFDAKDYVVSTKLMVLRSKGIVGNLLVYFFIKSDEVLNQLQTLAETRSGTFPQITYFELSKILINIPTQDILERFTAVLQSSFEKIRENQSEIQTRDTLLPKLMSGKIEIKN